MKLLKRFLIVFMVSIIFVYLVNLVWYKNKFTYGNISDSLFVAGFIMFSFGLITLSHASRLFYVIQYGFASVFKKKSLEHKSYYDYRQEKSVKAQNPYYMQIFIVGIMYIAVAFYLNSFI